MSVPVGGHRNAFKASFCHLPLEVGHRVVVRLLHVGQGLGFFSLSEIPDADNTVGAASSNDVSEFVVE